MKPKAHFTAPELLNPKNPIEVRLKGYIQQLKPQ